MNTKLFGSDLIATMNKVEEKMKEERKVDENGKPYPWNEE